MTGRRLGHFEILERLGAGGMGEVYKARDLELGRLVALKLLPEAAAFSADRRRRFGLEARAASALNHPNIVTIYEVARFETGDFIAMELVEGSTLNDMLRGGPLPLGDALKYASQIADALAAAHARHIVHRDLKPANIMITQRGLVKVLDFGLAKLTEPSPSDPGGEAETRTAQTQRGVIVGTLAYMSPEQAEGKRVDARSDIFSFGAVLYEMLSGERAFHGETTVSTLASILRDEPHPIARMRAEAPRELDGCIARCLRKKPEERFQSIEEVRVLLDDLTLGLSSGSVSRLLAAAGRHKRSLIAAAGLLLCAGLFYLYAPSARREPAAKDFALRRITNDTGLTTEPAISPDGKLVAYASDRAEGNLDIWVRHAAGGDSIRLTRDSADEREPSFSPDGARIVFRSERDGGGIYVAPALGGEIRMITKGGLRPRFSPDGKWIAYWTQDRFSQWGKVFVISAAGGAPRQIVSQLPDARSPIWVSEKSLLLSGALPGESRDWWLVRLDDNGTTPVRAGAADLFARAGLEGDPIPGDLWNDRIVFSANKGDTHNIWSVGFSQRASALRDVPERVTMGSSTDDSPNFSSAGTLVFSSGATTTDLWATTLDANSGAVTGSPARLRGDGVFGPDDPSLSMDGSVCAFVAASVDSTELRLRDMSTGHDTVVTATSKREPGADGKAHRVGRPFLSPDNKRIAFRNMIGATNRVSLIPASGGLPEDLCQDCGSVASWLPGGRSLLFDTGDRPQKTAILDTGTRERRTVLESAAWNVISAQVSPDSGAVAFCGRSGNRSTVFVAPWRGERIDEAEWIPVTEAAEFATRPCWSSNGEMLYFVQGTPAGIDARRIDPRTKRPSGPGLSIQRRPLARYELTRSNIGLSSRLLVVAVKETLANIWIRSSETR
jgi:Tol biopolymer transport system component